MFDLKKYETVRELLSTCYPLYFWEYDTDMRLFQTNCPESAFIDRLLSLNGMKDYLLYYCRTSEGLEPLEFCDDFGIITGCVISCHQGSADRILIMGPTFANGHSLERLYDNLDLHNLSVPTRKQIFAQFADFPVIPDNIFQQYLLMFHQGIRGEKLGFDSIVRKNSMHMDQAIASAKDSPVMIRFRETLQNYSHLPDAPKRLSEASYHLSEENTRDHAGASGFEQQLVSAVETGNMGMLDFLQEGAKYSNGIRANMKNDLQQMKYSAISLLTLCSRAAIRGGLASTIAYSMMDTYTLAIDNCATSADITHMNDAIFADFITRVHETNQNPAISDAVRTCTDYVNLHVKEKIRIETLSDLTGYSSYYLSHKFKQEMGMTLNQYIQKEKLKVAKILLETETTSITEIAENLNFCSQSYFSNLFYKEFGITPTQYRS